MVVVRLALSSPAVAVRQASVRLVVPRGAAAAAVGAGVARAWTPGLVVVVGGGAAVAAVGSAAVTAAAVYALAAAA